MKNVPQIFILLGAVVCTLLGVTIQKKLDLLKETPPEELWHKLLQENQKLINERLKNSLDQDSHIPITSIDSPGDLERPRRKAPQESSVKGWKKLWQNFQPAASLPKVIADTFPQLKIRRNLENLQTEEVTQVSSSKPIIEIFNEAEGRLLILGEPGSGKTTELLKLAQALGEAAAAEKNPKDPIPLIFELSTWRGEMMLDWMVGEIVAQYRLNPKLCREWLKGDRIVPLLDGLDELGEERAKEAIRAIDVLQEDYQNQQKALVICCRVKDYESITDDNKRRIRLKGVESAVRLEKLAGDQIEGYLKQRKAEHIWDELQSNSGLMELARNPMLLNLMPIAYPDELPDSLPQNFQDCQSRLFDDFLHRKLYPPQSITPQPLADYDPERAKDYLAWLAASMGREDINQREFFVEKLQPTWLENKNQRNQYSRINRLILGLIGGVISGLNLGLMGGLIYGLMGGLIGGISYGLAGGTISNFDVINLTESFNISWKNLRQSFCIILYDSLILGGFLGFVFWLTSGQIYWLIGGGTGGIIFGLIYGAIERIKTNIQNRKYPNQGIWETGLKSLITMGIAVFLCPLIWIIPHWATGENWNWNESLIVGVFLGIFFGYYLGGGQAFTQHFILRRVLCHHGRIPRNYVHFLNEASACGILKQSGGRYRFYHDQFREHLAATLQLKIEPVSYRQKKVFFRWLPYIGIGFTALLLFTVLSSTFRFNPYSVIAMNPVIQTTDRVWYDRFTYPRWRNPQRYQVISFSTQNLEENFSNELASRRILALPGETLEISSGQIILNGKLFEDNRIKLPSDFNQSLITLAIDECYVVGDNPDYDNFETFGAVVPLRNIRGQLVLRFYPFDRVGLIR
ncbi:S26 family signal peptidase [Laspinema olomoucense]|uniref:S26 family signal peptidase n=1 Tax=Laspinema olomoucense TaxID=3231600 RepID=UPI0021BAD602|nr:S26 family signal peptidase [Laspinema sp. D3a]